MDKNTLFGKGMVLMSSFCDINDIPTPFINTYELDEWHFPVCAYYRKNEIHICIRKCAHVGVAGRQWSYPGYVVDRTPFGVIQHELGHHVDFSRGDDKGAYWSDYSGDLRAETKEKPITTYCPNDVEWFAEIFRLFVTNPDLLHHMRPLTYNRLIFDGFKPVFTDSWQSRLRMSPERYVNAAQNKIKGK